MPDCHPSLGGFADSLKLGEMFAQDLALGDRSWRFLRGYLDARMETRLRKAGWLEVTV